MKKLFKLFPILGITLITSFLIGCSSDDDKNFEARILKMTFEDPIVVKQPVIEGTNVFFYVKGNVTESNLEKLIPVVEVSEDATINPESGSEVDFSEGHVKFIVTAGDGTTKTEYTVICVRSTNTESSLLGMTFDSSIVTKQPVIDSTNVFFEISNDATSSDLEKLIPGIELSDKATVNPILGSEVDFSKGAVKFTVTAGDGTTKTTYQIIPWQNKFSFENWVFEGNSNNSLNGREVDFYAPVANWSSSNTGAALLYVLEQSDKIVVTKTEDAHSGKSAAKIETIQSNKLDGTGLSLYPAITTGTLFMGTFQTDMLNVLKSTKFGVIYNKKPKTVKGYYKYTPGADFYRSTNANKSKVTLEPNTKDECVINAILYEVDAKDTPLTGVDAYTSPRLTAIGKLLDGTAKEAYTAFSIDMEYKKEYDSSKMYRFAIICSSSKWGDTFSGAPGSILYVDDIEIVSE
ncbi:MAG: PCMD domain-containing protein [Dysgonomonas sp.]